MVGFPEGLEDTPFRSNVSKSLFILFFLLGPLRDHDQGTVLQTAKWRLCDLLRCQETRAVKVPREDAAVEVTAQSRPPEHLPAPASAGGWGQKTSDEAIKVQLVTQVIWEQKQGTEGWRLYNFMRSVSLFWSLMSLIVSFHYHINISNI